MLTQAKVDIPWDLPASNAGSAKKRLYHATKDVETIVSSSVMHYTLTPEVLMPSIILKQNTNTLPMMHPSNRLSKNIPHLQHLQLLTSREMLLLGDGVRDDDFV